MKRLIAVLLVLAPLCVLLGGCTGSPSGPSAKAALEKSKNAMQEAMEKTLPKKGSAGDEKR